MKSIQVHTLTYLSFIFLVISLTIELKDFNLQLLDIFELNSQRYNILHLEIQLVILGELDDDLVGNLPVEVDIDTFQAFDAILSLVDLDLLLNALELTL